MCQSMCTTPIYMIRCARFTLHVARFCTLLGNTACECLGFGQSVIDHVVINHIKEQHTALIPSSRTLMLFNILRNMNSPPGCWSARKRSVT